MEQRVARLEEDHRSLAEKHNAAQEDRQRDLGLIYTRIGGMESDLRFIKWFAGTSTAAVIMAGVMWAFSYFS